MDLPTFETNELDKYNSLPEYLKDLLDSIRMLNYNNPLTWNSERSLNPV